MGGRIDQYAMTKHGLAAPAATGLPAPGLHAADVILLFAGLFQMDPGTDWKAQSAACSTALPSRGCRRIRPRISAGRGDLRDLAPGGLHEFGIGVRMARQPPAALDGLGEQDPGPLGQRRVMSSWLTRSVN